MARIFNIYFTYDDILHSAIVSVHINPAYTEYILGNLDAELKILLPGNKIIAPTGAHLFFPGILPGHSLVLMKSILKSLGKQLHTGYDLPIES
jgi:hypothetical protein